MLAEDTESYFKRLNVLTTEYPIFDNESNLVNLAQLINAAKEKAKLGQTLNTNDKLYLSILSFMDGLLMYHKPSKTSLYSDSVDARLYSQNWSQSSRYVLNDEVVNIRNGISSPLTICFDRPFVGTKKEYLQIMQSLIGNLNKLNVPFFVHLSTNDHSTGLSNISDKARIYDANAMTADKYYYPYNESEYMQRPINECVNGLFFVFKKSRATRAINITVYLRPEDAGKSFSAMNQMFDEELANSMKDKIVKQLEDYPDLYKWQRYHRNARASFTSVIIKQIKTLEKLQGYLQEEKQLCSGNNIGQCKYVHFNGNTPSTRHGKDSYYEIIDKALKELSKLIMQGEYQKYLQYFLPQVINKKHYINTLFLFIACQNGHTDVVRELIKLPEINCNETDEGGATPLYVASQNGHTDIVRILLKGHMIDVNKKTDEFTALQIACKCGNLGVVKLLIKARGIDVNQPTNNGTTALLIACKAAKDDVILALLAKNPRRSNKFNEYETYTGNSIKVKEKLRIFRGI
ncbi:MAG: ankyrin repeat domain-containing protein [Lentisphaerae bacterium]|nr:ankyrin repeat domain-containing protein [Lentisphaerota bacterium]MCP4102547.1 ankyrin repeat domain-containing protein [Lentisphaerota bacterium]